MSRGDAARAAIFILSLAGLIWFLFKPEPPPPRDVIETKAPFTVCIDCVGCETPECLYISMPGKYYIEAYYD